MITTVKSDLISILYDPGFCQSIVDAIDWKTRFQSGKKPTEKSRRIEFTEMLRRTSRRIEDHPRRDVMLQILRDSSLLVKRDFYGFLDFVQYGLVNHFKGEIAEMLSMQYLGEYCDMIRKKARLSHGIDIISGNRIQTRRMSGGTGWTKGADALFAIPNKGKCDGKDTPKDANSFNIVGMAEIKSARRSTKSVIYQMRNQLARMRIGMRLDGQDIRADRLKILTAGRSGELNWISLKSGRQINSPLRLVIVPVASTIKQERLVQIDRSTWLSEIEYPASDLHEAAYLFAIWYLGQAGKEVFRMPGSNVAGKIDNPHPEMSFEKAATNRFIEALYFFGYEEDLLHLPPQPEHSKEERRKRSTFCWLYNSLAYGHDMATGKDVLVPEEVREIAKKKDNQGKLVLSEEDKLKDLFSECHNLLSDGNLEEALILLENIKSQTTLPEHMQNAAWLDGMIAFRDARLSDAIRKFPGPYGPSEKIWWARDQIMLARLHIRNGKHEEGIRLLNILNPIDKWPNRAIPIEYATVETLAYAHGGNLKMALEKAEACQAKIDEVNGEIKERRRKGQSLPIELSFPSFNSAMIDLAVVRCLLGDPVKAAAVIDGINYPEKWMPRYLRKDEILSPHFKKVGFRKIFERWEASFKWD